MIVWIIDVIMSGCGCSEHAGGTVMAEISPIQSWAWSLECGKCIE